jgi:hypothetical protein
MAFNPELGTSPAVLLDNASLDKLVNGNRNHYLIALVYCAKPGTAWR